MDVKYVEKAPKGKACKDCQYFEDTGVGMGKCFGHEVFAKGGCNKFEAKSSQKSAGTSSAKPRIFSKEAFLIAGVAGSGDETGKAWETYMKLEKVSPLKNKVGEEGYEVRMYPAAGGPGKIHVGVQVKDSNVPKEYKLFFVSAATYAEFEIYPAKGYESSNAEMSKWLEDNAGAYKEALLDGMHYAIEVYDKRFKGDKDPKSVVEIWMPVYKPGPEATAFWLKMIDGQVHEIGRRTEQFAGAEVRKKVMADQEKVAASGDPVKGSIWFKEAIDRLDMLTDKKTREQIMHACGCNCHAVNYQDTEKVLVRRFNAASEEEFLADEIQPRQGTGIRYERHGNTLIQYYTPRKYGQGTRCYCYLVSGLPENVNVSPTYCQCSRAWVEKHWEAILGRPVKVEVKETALTTGSEECKFIIHL